MPPRDERDDRAPASSTPAEPGVPKDERDDGPAATADPLTQVFEQRYDDLHPVDFAKAVFQFGDGLERQGKDLPAAEKAEAAAEYAFLQDRLSFWLAYEYTPLELVGNLQSAAMALYRGAIFAGLATAGHIPPSMLDVAGTLAFFSNGPAPRLGIPEAETGDLPFRVPGERLPEPEALGGTVDNSDVGINWSQGIKAQGVPFETFVAEQDPTLRSLPPTSKTFDLFDDATGSAVSVKTLNTLTVNYIKNPQSIYSRLSSYVDAAADYQPRLDTDLQPGDIKTKTIQLGVPEYTSPTQWRFLYWAILYGNERDVSIVLTRIRQ